MGAQSEGGLYEVAARSPRRRAWNMPRMVNVPARSEKRADGIHIPRQNPKSRCPVPRAAGAFHYGLTKAQEISHCFCKTRLGHQPSLGQRGKTAHMWPRSHAFTMGLSDQMGAAFTAPRERFGTRPPTSTPAIYTQAKRESLASIPRESLASVAPTRRWTRALSGVAEPVVNGKVCECISNGLDICETSGVQG